MVGRSIVVALGGLLACSGPARTKSPVPAPVVVIRVTHPERDRFHVEYTLPSPLARVPFQRPSLAVREKWTAAEARIEHVGKSDALVAPSPRSTFALDIPYSDFEPEKDYRTTFRFTDGGTLLYTGHLGILESPGTITLVAGDGESVVVRGQAPGSAASVAMGADGTYAYFGTEKPIETDEFVGVIDRGFPPTIRADMDALLPRLFRYYSSELGRPPGASQKPLLLATYTRTDHGASLNGGVMPPRVVSFGFEFPDRPIPSFVQPMVEQNVAHESAHLWNADLYDGAEPWLKEGTADALAFRSLRALGTLDEQGYRTTLSNALSRCVVAMAEGRGLADSSRPGHSEELYFCGSTLALVTEAAAREPLTRFMKEVFAGTGPDHQYGARRYLEVLAAKSPDAADFVRRASTTVLADPAQDFARALVRFGVEVAPVAENTEEYDRTIGPYAIRALLAPAEDGNTVESLAGVDIKHGAAAWDAAFARCTATGAVDIGRKGKAPVAIPCAKPARARPPYLRTTKTP